MKKIIIVSYGDDGHTKCLLEEAGKNGIEAILFDAGGYPITDKEEISIDYENGISPKLRMSIGGTTVNGEDVSGIWWRRPRGTKSFGRSGMDQYMHLEGEVVIRSLKEFLLHINWVSDPEATRMACRKPVQLAVAKEVGLQIPSTCISNSPVAVKDFMSSLGGRGMIMKPVGTSFVDLSQDQELEDGGSKVIFTQIVDRSVVLDNLDLIKNCPVIFQEAVEKDSDVRITVVDGQVFCAEIILENCSNPKNVDWRNHDGIRVYRRHKLPKRIKDLCVQFTNAMGLRFGCIDMAYSSKSGYTFFEINPQGQWLPSQIELDYPISAALLKSLTKQSG